MTLWCLKLKSQTLNDDIKIIAYFLSYIFDREFQHGFKWVCFNFKLKLIMLSKQDKHRFI